MKSETKRQTRWPAAVALVGALLALGGSGWAPAETWAPKELPISFWCGPPDGQITVERYKQIADAGFNYLMPPCEGRSTPERNKLILETAKKVGLKAFLQDERMPFRIAGDTDAKAKADAIIADYSRHSAFAGYFVFDEPSEFRFAGLGEVTAYLAQKDPKHPAYFNLYPNYVPIEELGTLSYEAYVREFVRAIPIEILSFDHYPFLKESDRPLYIANLELIRRVATERKIPFWQIVQLIEHGGYRSPTEAELRWQTMQTLAYGGQGVMYFTYCTPTDKSFQWGPAILDKDFKPTERYGQVQRINHDLKLIGDYLINMQYLGTFHSGEVPKGAQAQFDGSQLAVDGTPSVTIGLFRTDKALFALIANRDYKAKTPVNVKLTGGTGQNAFQLDKATGKWLEFKSGKEKMPERRVSLTIAPGDAELLRW
jgi:hypothetical protein